MPKENFICKFFPKIFYRPKKFPLGGALHPESEDSRAVASEAGFGEASRTSHSRPQVQQPILHKHWNKES